MNNVRITNLDYLKKILKKYKLDKLGSKKFTGYASIDKPWEKNAVFVKKNIDIPDTSYIDVILNRSKINSVSELFKCHEASITEEQFKNEMKKCAVALKNQGIKKGDIVCLCMNESIECSVIEAALNVIGAVSANLPSNASPLGLEGLIKKLNSKFIFTSDSHYNSVSLATKNIDNIVKCVVPSDYSFRNINVLSKETIEYLRKSKINYDENSSTMSYESFLNKGKDYKNTEINETVHADDPAKILFTSGTSGQPKPIFLSNKNIISELIRLKNQTHMNLGQKGICLKVVADMYPYGNIVSKWFVVYVNKTVGLTPTLNESNAYYYMNMYKPTYVQGIPSFYYSLENDEKIKKDGLSYLKYAVSGGEKYETIKKMKTNEFFKSVGSTAKILDGSGAGEMVACSTTSVGTKYNINSVGKPMVGLNVKIIEDKPIESYKDVKELKYGEDGLICYSGDSLMIGYYDNDELTAENIFYDENGTKWFMTDGIGHMDEKGYLYIVSRKARCFIAYDEKGSGYKISPEEIEEVILSCDGIDTCVVVSKTIKNEFDKENKIPKVYIKLKDGYFMNDDLKNKIEQICKNSTLPYCSQPKSENIHEWNGNWPKINDTKTNFKLIQKISDEEEQKNVNRRL